MATIRYARFLALSVALIGPTVLRAQRDASWDLGLQIMSSPDASRKDLWFGGQTDGIRQSAIAIRASTDLLKVGPLHLRYSAQMLPVIALSNTEAYQTIRRSARTVYVLGDRASAFGFGLIPIGLDIGVDLGSHVRAQIGAAAGILRFTHNIPVAASRQRNFSAQSDVMVEWRFRSDRALQAGVRWVHISNGYTAYENPGIDNRMLVAGYRMAIRRR